MAVRASGLPTSQQSSCCSHIWLASGLPPAAELSLSSRALQCASGSLLTFSSKAGQPAPDVPSVCSHTDPVLRMTCTYQRSLVSATDDRDLYTHSCLITCCVMTINVQRHLFVMLRTRCIGTGCQTELLCASSLTQFDNKASFGECIQRLFSQEHSNVEMQHLYI